MNQVISKDGTIIAFDRSGEGPAVILVDGYGVVGGVESGAGCTRRRIYESRIARSGQA